MRGSRGTSQPYLRGRIWWIRFRLSDGKEYRESSRSTDKQIAQFLLKERQRQSALLLRAQQTEERRFRQLFAWLSHSQRKRALSFMESLSKGEPAHAER